MFNFLEGIWDALDIENSYLEGSSLFVSTKIVQHLLQTKGVCQDLYRDCVKDTDCYTFINETCLNGLCNVKFGDESIIEGP